MGQGTAEVRGGCAAMAKAAQLCNSGPSRTREARPAVWRTPFSALLTIPATIALAIAASAWPLVLLERHYGSPEILRDLTTDAIRSFLPVVATGAMTALTLAYSLTLVVFTLAASSIGPRLLKRFTTERLNQVTAGLLGGTFLYALVVIGATGGPPPRIATVGAAGLAVASVVQLIWFVRNVAQSVSVDDEIAAIAARLRRDLERLKAEVDRAPKMEDRWVFRPVAQATETGYLVHPDRVALCSLAQKADVVVRLDVPSGEYVLAGTPVLSANGALSPAETEALGKLVTVEPARSDSGTVQFAVNLLVEIALRALSPGVNDTFTALAVSDMLSGALVEIADDEPRPAVLSGADGSARAILPGVGLRNVFGQAFHPLRRAAFGNVLMAQGLARAYGRLYDRGGEVARTVMAEHARLLLDDLGRASLAAPDVESVIALLPEPLRGIGAQDQAEDRTEAPA